MVPKIRKEKTCRNHTPDSNSLYKSGTKTQFLKKLEWLKKAFITLHLKSGKVVGGDYMNWPNYRVMMSKWSEIPTLTKTINWQKQALSYHLRYPVTRDFQKFLYPGFT